MLKLINMKPKPANSKEFNAKHTKLLQGLLKLPENKECADCRSKAPRWASINLGIFICLQCSGIHRSLGVHISKVRSVTLDTWLPEHVAFVQSMGNEKSNAYWEAELPWNYDRGRIENFIRAKYVEQRWIPRDCKVQSPSKYKQELGSSRRCSSRRFGCIAEWTNNQHIFKQKRDCSRPDCGEVRKDCAGNEDQHQGKKENCQPSKDQSTFDLKIFDGEPSKLFAQAVHNLNSNGSLRKSEQEGLKRSSTGNAVPAAPPPKVDYGTELLKSLCTDDSVDKDSSPPDTSAWVRFDSDDQVSSIPDMKLVPKPMVAEAAVIHEANLTPKISVSKDNPGLKVADVQTAMVPFTAGHSSQHQKNVTNDSQSLSEKHNMFSASSIHLQRLAMLGQGVSSTDGPFLGSIHHQHQPDGGSIERTTGTQMPMQNSQPVKLTKSATYSVSSLYRPTIPSKGVSTAPARRPPTTLPVSGYDYDFSFLTQGMFTKR